jgi:hypothetical protein
MFREAKEDEMRAAIERAREVGKQADAFFKEDAEQRRLQAAPAAPAVPPHLRKPTEKLATRVAPGKQMVVSVPQPKAASPPTGPVDTRRLQSRVAQYAKNARPLHLPSRSSNRDLAAAQAGLEFTESQLTRARQRRGGKRKNTLLK